MKRQNEIIWAGWNRIGKVGKDTRTPINMRYKARKHRNSRWRKGGLVWRTKQFKSTNISKCKSLIPLSCCMNLDSNTLHCLVFHREELVNLSRDYLRLSDITSNLTFVGPCIVIYFYSKTNQMHNIANLFYFGTTFYMFRTVSPSIIRSLRLYIYLMLHVQS